MDNDLLKKFKDLIIHKEYYTHLNGNGYVVNVKLYHAFDYNKETIISYFKNNNYSNDIINKISNWLDDADIDAEFWEDIQWLQRDLLDLAQYNNNEINYIKHKTIFTGRSGGYFGFDYSPKDIVTDYENGYMEDDEMMDNIKELEQINMVLNYAEDDAKHISINDTIITHIECNEIDGFETESKTERQYQDILTSNKTMLENIDEQLKLINLKAEYKTIN